MKKGIEYIIKDRFFVTKAKLFVEGKNFDFSKFAISIFNIPSCKFARELLPVE